MAKKYIALFEFGSESVGVVFPDFPGCVSVGDNFDDAVRMAHEALAFHIDGMRNDGETIPEPRTLEQIKSEWEDWNEWQNSYNFSIGFVEALPFKPKDRRINISMAEDLLYHIDSITNNRSGFIDSVLRQSLNDFAAKQNMRR
jgi:predicted RNase H-like HicB family nuclease